MKTKDIQLGLCCLNKTLRDQKPTIFSSRGMIMSSIKKLGIGELKRRIILNLEDTLKLIEWNEKNGIKVFRLSSNIFPHKSNPRIDNYDFDFAKPLLTKIGKLAKKYNQRLTFHPGQYNVIGTPIKSVFDNTILTLKYQADVLDLMGCNNNSVMVIHGGGVYCNKKVTMKRWVKQFYLLPKNVQRRLVLENDERCYNIKDCLEISKKINIPVVFDTHHFSCYKIAHPDVKFRKAAYYMSKILKTWKRRGIKPKFHVSEQGIGRLGHHSKYIKVLPQYLLDIPKKYGVKIDIMIEAKEKELAIFDLYKKYPQLDYRIKN
jgi:UV DNA damage endonuclease